METPTDQAAVEIAARASEARYRTLFEYAPDGILIADGDSFYIDANASICRMLGYRHDELIGLNASDIVSEAEVPFIASALRAIADTPDYRREWQFRRKDGSMFAADVMARLMPDGNVLAMVRDITERDRAIEALRTAEERARFVLKSADVGMWDIEYPSGLLKCSDTLEAQYGLPPGQCGGTFESFVARMHPDDRPVVLETLAKAMKAGGDFSMQNRAIWPDGTVRWLSGSGRVYLGDDGTPVRGVGISQDVTERRSLELQFHQAQKMEAVGRLASGVAHDFNNLLMVILGYSEILLADIEADDSHRGDISEIHRAGVRGAALTRQLLAFSRKAVIEPTLLNLNDVVGGMQPMIRRLIGEDVRIVLGLSHHVTPVKADRGQLEQIVLNLVVNARDAMPAGGTLTIATANVELDEDPPESCAGMTPGTCVTLTVSDTGTGITPQVRARLFEPFFTTKEVGKGTGLGLATVQGIVLRCGGRIDVQSSVGKGASFKMYFPCAEDADGAVVVAEPPPKVVRPNAGAETVLLVDDAAELRELAKRLLERLGYTVLVAESADEAIQCFAANPSISVLLTDVVMPGASGPELTRQLVEQRPALKVIYMSGYTEEAIVHQGVLPPGIIFLHKPFTSDDLGRKIRQALDT